MSLYRSNVQPPWGLLVGLGLGAAVMYLLDPGAGRRRRAVARDKALSTFKTTGGSVAKKSRDLGNRTRGLVAEAGSRLRREQADDRVLGERVRSELGHVVSHPSGIDVTVREGRATLSGHLLAGEHEPLLLAVVRVRGISDVEDRLQVHESDEELHRALGAAGQSHESPAGQQLPQTVSF